MKHWKQSVLLLIPVLTILLSGCKKSENKEKQETVETQSNQLATAQESLQKIKEPEQIKPLQNNSSFRYADISYAEAKALAKTANARFAAAWRRIPQPLRNNLQHSISYMTSHVDQKCKNHSHAYPEGESRRAQYLYCSLSHENLLSDGIERFAYAYNRNSAANFFDYVNPEGIISTSNW